MRVSGQVGVPMAWPVAAVRWSFGWSACASVVQLAPFQYLSCVEHDSWRGSREDATAGKRIVAQRHFDFMRTCGRHPRSRRVLGNCLGIVIPHLVLTNHNVRTSAWERQVDATARVLCGMKQTTRDWRMGGLSERALCRKYDPLHRRS